MAVSNQLVQRTATEVSAKTFDQFVNSEKVKCNLLGKLGSEDAVQEMKANVISAITVNPDLNSCDFSTLVSAGLIAHSLKLPLSPSLGFAHLLPFEDRKNNRKVATFVLGWRGYVQLAVRSGYYKKIIVMDVKQGELKHFDPVEEEIKIEIIEDEFEREKLPTIGYYAFFEHHNGFRKLMYWTKSKMLSHANRYSQAFSVEAINDPNPKRCKVSFADFEAGKVPSSEMWKYSSYWYRDFDKMALKTMIRQLISKWGIMSIDMQKAYEKDSDQMAKEDEYSVDTNTVTDDFFEGTESVIEAGFDDPEPTEDSSVVEPESTPAKRTRKPKEEKKPVNFNETDDFFNSIAQE